MAFTREVEAATPLTLMIALVIPSVGEAEVTWNEMATDESLAVDKIIEVFHGGVSPWRGKSDL